MTNGSSLRQFIPALLVAFATSAPAAVIIENSAVSVNGNPGNPDILSYSTIASTDVLLVGFAGFMNNGANGVTSITYDGSAMALVPSSLVEDNRLESSWYYLFNPGVVTGNIDITVDGTGHHYLNAVAYSVEGPTAIEHLSAFTRTTDTFATSVSVVESVIGASLAIDLLASDDTTTATLFNSAQAGQTEIFNRANPSFADRFAGSSHQVIGGGGSLDIGWDFGQANTDNEGSAYSVLALGESVVSRVPEPGSVGLGLIGALLLTYVRRKVRGSEIDD